MKRNIEVIHNILPLLVTIEEALVHVKKQISEIRYEEAFGLLEDCMMAIASIESGIESMEEISKERIVLLTDMLKKAIINVIESYENKKQELVANQIELEVLPKFILWKNELELMLKPTTLS